MLFMIISLTWNASWPELIFIESVYVQQSNMERCSTGLDRYSVCKHLIFIGSDFMIISETQAASTPDLIFSELSYDQKCKVQCR